MKRLFAAAMFAVALGQGAVGADPQPDATCWWSPNPVTVGELVTLSASGLPTNDTFALTFDLYPVGTTMTTVDGTFTTTRIYGVPGPVTAYFWQRGGGKSLVKPGPGLNDYRVIAVCTVDVVAAP